ncbi:MAG: hypothetical protein HY264_06405 [Chloroflexi bacterium]|nr:hypothetical protein [Chloroflexota bacterium]
MADDTAAEPSGDIPEASQDAPQPEAGVTQDTSTATIEHGSAAWPTSDEAPIATSSVPEPTRSAAAPLKARRDNLLVTGLVRAMHEAAQAARDEALTKFAETAKARVEGIHAESADAAAEIRRQSEQDIAGIRDWSKAEMARVREETEERIADRKRRLETEVDDHAARVEHRIELVQGAVATFEGQMERFFTALLAENDPARLAGFAEQLPEPPALEDDGGLEDWQPARTLDADNAAAAEASFLADIEVTDIGSDAADADAADAETMTDEDHLAVDDAHVVERLAAFTDPASGREVTTSTNLSVVGLISVASIASFKRALGRAPGVRGVSVSSGPNGDFVFTVQHAASVDLRTLIPELDRFSATITGDADGVLTVSASEPSETN